MTLHVGQRIHRLVILSEAEAVRSNRRWLCRCDCGTEKVIRSCNLKSQISCGCYRREFAKTVGRVQTHGMSYTPTYKSWQCMKSRCLDSNDPHYPDYGGRGIKICKRWLKFENFLEDMGKRPEGKTLDRKNNDKGYSKSNCRWASPKEQANNRRRK